MTRIIALTALTALGSPGEPFHEPFHDPTTASATQRYHAPGGLRQPGPADNSGAPTCAHRTGPVCRVMALARVIECWFGYLTDQKIRRGEHKSVQVLEADIWTWIAS
jgi:hypothetical protein